jgi:uncharacterized protein with GYD domain
MEDIAMHFCLTGQYTPQALNSIMDNPTVSRYEAAKNLMLVIFDVPDPNVAPAISGVVLSTGAMHNAKLTRLWTPDEITQVRKKASELRGVYKPPGK